MSKVKDSTAPPADRKAAQTSKEEPEASPPPRPMRWGYNGAEYMTDEELGIEPPTL